MGGGDGGMLVKGYSFRFTRCKSAEWAELAGDTRGELDLRGEEDSIRGEKGEGLFRKGEQVRKVRQE